MEGGVYIAEIAKANDGEGCKQKEVRLKRRIGDRSAGKWAELGAPLYRRRIAQSALFSQTCAALVEQLVASSVS